MRKTTTLFALLAALGAGCSEARVVGQACGSDGDCGGLSESYCPEAGICTRPCRVHSDCGCAEDTTNADLEAGRCEASCVDFGEDVAVCMRRCEDDGDCDGPSECRRDLDLDYGVCL